MNPSCRNDRGAIRKTILLEGGPNQRLEVELSLEGQGRRELVLRELCWGTGVGWFTHKSVKLEAPQIDSLLKALCCLRQPSSRERCCPLLEGQGAAGAGEAEAPGDAVASAGKGPSSSKVLRVDFKGR
jgi:hypothetical protein